MTNEEIFEKNINLAYKYAHGYKNCGMDFDDVIQLCLLGLWKAIQTYDGKHQLSTYAYLVMRNELYMVLARKEKKYKENVVETIDNEDELDWRFADKRDFTEDLIDKIEHEEKLKKVKEAMEDLTERDKQIFGCC